MPGRNRAAYLDVTPRPTARGDEPVYFLALATDYDGTLAHDGVVDPETLSRHSAGSRSPVGV